jgi:hypothetical protein
MAVAAIGLTPISPTTEVLPVVVIPDFARIVKLPAVPRSTGWAEDCLATRRDDATMAATIRRL